MYAVHPLVLFSVAPAPTPGVINVVRHCYRFIASASPIIFHQPLLVRVSRPTKYT